MTGVQTCALPISAEIHSISTQAALAAQVEALQRQLNQMNAPQQQLMSCEFCAGDHDSINCQVSTTSEQANFMGNFQGGQTIFKDHCKTNSKTDLKTDFLDHKQIPKMIHIHLPTTQDGDNIPTFPIRTPLKDRHNHHLVSKHLKRRK